jgi:serine phosphatase RsbU (regulator of sigma subunit)/HAMP domain-containing protein
VSSSSEHSPQTDLSLQTPLSVEPQKSSWFRALKPKPTQKAAISLPENHSAPKSKRAVRFPFSLKLALALSMLSVGIASASVYWLYVRTETSVLEDMAMELKKVGLRSLSDFDETDFAAIEKLQQNLKASSLPLTPEILTASPPTRFRGLSSITTQRKIFELPYYQQLARKLGEITNRSRRDNKSDVYILHTFLVGALPESPNRKVVRILADDDAFRYSITRNEGDNWIGEYYVPIYSLSKAFEGSAVADGMFHQSIWGTIIVAAIPIKDKTGQVVAVMGLTVDVQSIAKQLDRLKETYVHVLLASLIVSVLFSFLLSQWLVRPLTKLRLAAEKVKRHEFDVEIDVNGNDELQLLAETFNAMVTEIRNYTDNLEHLVEERTCELNQTKQELELDLEKGQKLQRDFLPEPLIDLPNWEIATAFEPAKKVAGDFYDVFILPGNLVGLVIADVCDKGVGAAMFMGLFRSFIRVFSGQICFQQQLTTVGQNGKDSTLPVQQQDALKAVEITNNYISKEHAQTGMFATMFFGVLNPQTGCLTYINGGHEPLYVIDNTGIREVLSHTGPAVGMMPNVQFKVRQVHLKPEDILIGYTDGVTDARSPEGTFFTSQRLLALLKQPATTATELVECIKQAVISHVGSAPQFDDITMLAIQQHLPDLRESVE